MEAYLDNSATTEVCDEAARVVVNAMKNDYGNPSSLHRKGFEAQLITERAADTLGRILKCDRSEIVFTSGGTESDNLAIVGSALRNKRKGRHLVTTRIEHPAVYEAFKYLESEGFEVTYLDVDEKGVISLRELEASIREDTSLVSVMHVNNETGAVQPVREAGALIKKKNPSCIFHVDDIQGFTKLWLAPGREDIDLLSVSGHKIHAPKGVGALYVKKGVRLSPVIPGGGQQGGLRSGTENVPGIAGLAAAADMLQKADRTEDMYALRKEMVTRLCRIENVRVNGPCTAREYEAGDEDRERFAPHIISLTVPGVRAEVLLHAMEDKGVYVSAGSACSSHKRAPSRTLSAMGFSSADLESTVRISFSAFTTREETAYASAVIEELVPQLRMFTRR